MKSEIDVLLAIQLLGRVGRNTAGVTAIGRVAGTTYTKTLRHINALLNRRLIWGTSTTWRNTVGRRVYHTTMLGNDIATAIARCGEEEGLTI